MVRWTDGRGLRRRIDLQAAVVLGNGERRLRLEIDVLLSAGIGPAADHDMASGPGLVHVAQGERAGDADERAAGVGFPRIEDGRKRLDLESDQGPGGAGGFHAFRDDKRDGLADEVDFVRGQQRLVLDDVADLVLSREYRGP